MSKRISTKIGITFTEIGEIWKARQRYKTSWIRACWERKKDIFKGLFIWRRAVPVDRAGSVKNVLKKKCVHMITEPARLNEISVDLGEMKISHMNSHPGWPHAQFNSRAKIIWSRDVNKRPSRWAGWKFYHKIPLPTEPARSTGTTCLHMNSP